MPRDYHFRPQRIDIPALSELEGKWKNIKNSDVRKALSVESQYLIYHECMIDQVRHNKVGNSARSFKLAFSVRAGAVKTYTLLLGSIVEASLRYYGEELCLSFAKKETGRTFGNVLHTWEGSEYTATHQVLLF